MKHQVFFFLLIFSFSAYSMNQEKIEIINRLTGNQLTDTLNLYCSVHPQFSDDTQVKECIDLSKKTSLTFEDKLTILSKMQGFNRPDVVRIGNRFIELEREEHEVEAKAIY